MGGYLTDPPMVLGAPTEPLSEERSAPGFVDGGAFVSAVASGENAQRRVDVWGPDLLAAVWARVTA